MSNESMSELRPDERQPETVNPDNYDPHSAKPYEDTGLPELLAQRRVSQLVDLITDMGGQDLLVIEDQIRELQEGIARLQAVRSLLQARQTESVKEGFELERRKVRRSKKQEFVLPPNYMNAERTKKLNESEVLAAEKRIKILKWMHSKGDKGYDLTTISQEVPVAFTGLNKTMFHKYFDMKGDQYFISVPGRVALGWLSTNS